MTSCYGRWGKLVHASTYETQLMDDLYSNLQLSYIYSLLSIKYHLICSCIDF